MQSIVVNGQLLPIDPAAFASLNNRETIVDSGTTLAYLVEEAFDPFVSAITIVMRQTIRSCRPIDSYATEKSLKKSDDVIPPPRSLMAYMATIVVDFMFVVLPMVLFFTVLSEWVIVGSFSLFLY